MFIHNTVQAMEPGVYPSGRRNGRQAESGARTDHNPTPLSGDNNRLRRIWCIPEAKWARGVFDSRKPRVPALKDPYRGRPDLTIPGESHTRF